MTAERTIKLCAILATLLVAGCGKHPLPEHTSEPRSHTYVFGDRVGFGHGGDSARFRRYGWATTEPHSTRTRPRGAALHFNVVDSDRPLTLRMNLSRIDEVDGAPVQPVEVAVNGQKITQWNVERRGYYTCVIPAELVKVDPVVGPAAFVVVDLHTPMSEPQPLVDAARSVPRQGIRVWELFMVEGAEPRDHHSRTAPESPDGSAYTYGEAVSFGIEGTGERYNLGGWDNSDGIFTWTAKSPAALGFRVAPAEGSLWLKLRAAIVTSGARLQVQPVELRINGEKLAEWTIGEPLQWFTAEIPAHLASANGVLRVELAPAARARDAAASIPRELRPRGVQLHDLLISDET